MTHRTVALSQMGTLFFLILLPLATEGLCGMLAQAGRAGWLCPLLAGLLLLLPALWLTRKGSWEGPDLGLQAVQRWGKGPGRGLMLIWLLWGLVLTAAHASRIGSRLSDALRASPVLLIGAVLLLSGWLAAGGLPALTRACRLFALAVGLGFVLVAAFGLFRLEWADVLLWRGWELAEVPDGAVTLAGTLAVGAYALVFRGDIREGTVTRRQGLLRLAGLTLPIALSMILVLGRLGPALAEQIDRPFFQMVSGLGLEGTFQRLESLVSAVWLLGDISLLAFLLLCLGRLTGQLLDRPDQPAFVWAITVGIFFLSLPTAFWQAVLSVPLLPRGTLAAAVLMAAAAGMPPKNCLKKFQKKC